MRILSCQSDQLSIESERWGGGRGVFSYFLVNGLKGLADEEGDRQVVFYELKNYLRSNMRKAIQESGINNEQTAVFVGQDEYFRLAKVDSATLFAARAELEKPALASANFSLAGSKDVYFAEKIGDLLQKRAAMDAFASVVELRAANEKDYFPESAMTDPAAAVEWFAKDFSHPDSFKKLDTLTQKGVLDFLELATKSREDAALRSVFYPKIAIKLHDIAQKAINRYLEGDAGELAGRYYKNQISGYAQYARMLKLAIQLLPESHPLREICQVKYHYFNGVSIRLKSQLADSVQLSAVERAMAEQLLALGLDEKTAYIHNELGILWAMKGDLEKSRHEFRAACSLAPSWAIAFSNLGGNQIMRGELDSAEINLERAFLLNPKYYGTFINKGFLFEKRNNLLAGENAYRQAKTENPINYSAYQKLAHLLLKTTRYDEAETRFKEFEDRRKDAVFPPIPKYYADAATIPWEEKKEDSTFLSPPFLIKNPVSAADFYQNGRYFYARGKMLDAEICFNKCIKLDNGHVEALDLLSKMLFSQKRFGEAEILYLRLTELFPLDGFRWMKLAADYREWGRPEIEEQIYDDLIENFEDRDVVQMALDGKVAILKKQGRFNEEEKLLLTWGNLKWGTKRPNLPWFYAEMTARFPENPDWLYKNANLQFEFLGANKYNIPMFKKVIEIDTGYAARAYLHNLIGQYFLEKAKQGLLAEKMKCDQLHGGEWYFEDTLWHTDLLEANNHFGQAIARAPKEMAQKFGLISGKILDFQYDSALKTLDNLQKNKQLDFENLLKLADLKARAGQFVEADSLLKTAQYWQPATVGGLPEAIGKLAHHNPDTAIEALKGLLTDHEARTARSAAEALVRIGDARAIPALESLATNAKSAIMRDQAAKWVAELKEKSTKR